MNQSNTKRFIEKSKKVHGDRYNYDNVSYINSVEKVIIKCKLHGDFLQSPNSHIRGRGCSECKKLYFSEIYRHNVEDILKVFNEIHGNEYDYSLVDYVSYKKKVKIICKKHGVFNQSPRYHIKGSGCPECGKIKTGNYRRFSKDKFIEESIKTHGNRYDYSKVNYKNTKTNVNIVCENHGVFIQCPSDHLKGRGCPQCARIILSYKHSLSPNGWGPSNWDNAAKKSKNFDSFKVYIIRCWNDDEEFYKVGRTFLKTKKRFYCKYVMPYNYDIIEEIIFDNAKDAFDKELQLKSLNKDNKYLPNIPFNGMQECFNKIKI